MSTLTPTRPVDAAVISSPEDCARCESIYREAFGLGPGDGTLNARLLIGLGRNSGIVIGGYGDGQLVGFALSFLARQDTDGRLYQFSQTAAVLAAWRGRGVGRAMKFAQRQAALDAGVDLMRWTFDPLRPANAHFNLDVLGGFVSGLARDLYGPMSIPEDHGEPTDRFIVDWELSRSAVAGRAQQLEGTPASGSKAGQPRQLHLEPGSVRPGELTTLPGHSLLAVPADWNVFRRASPSAAAGLRNQILTQAQQLLDAGLAAVSCIRLDRDTAIYRFAQPAREQS